MNNPLEKINNIKEMDDFLNFVVELARDANEHPEEWTNTMLTDFVLSWRKVEMIKQFIEDANLRQTN